MSEIVIIGVIIGISGIFSFLILTYFLPLSLLFAALASGVKVTPLELIGMRFRRVSPHAIVNSAIMVKKGGFEIPLQALESHSLAGGNVTKVASALVAAQEAGINLTFKQAIAIDLAGHDVLYAVKLCEKPKIIQTPMLTGMTKNGIQVKVIARVTVKADINKLVSGAAEETLLARVGESIVTTIGSASGHEKILESLDRISKTIQDKGLDADTALEILSIDIANVDS